MLSWTLEHIPLSVVVLKLIIIDYIQLIRSLEYYVILRLVMKAKRMTILGVLNTWILDNSSMMSDYDIFYMSVLNMQEIIEKGDVWHSHLRWGFDL
jgi:hypothetical protein